LLLLLLVVELVFVAPACLHLQRQQQQQLSRAAPLLPLPLLIKPQISASVLLSLMPLYTSYVLFHLHCIGWEAKN
jgi:hypothetical protein